MVEIHTGKLLIMNKEQKDFIWRCLPKEVKLELKLKHRKYNSFSSKRILEGIVGKHNLLSDVDPEEMLSCDKSKLQELVKECKKAGQNQIAWHIVGLFGNKCLPDKEEEIKDQLNTEIEFKSQSELERPFIRSNPKFYKGDRVVGCEYIAKDYPGIMEIIKCEYNELRSCYIYCTKEFENVWFPEPILEFYKFKIGEKVIYPSGGEKDKVYTVISVNFPFVEILPGHFVCSSSLELYIDKKDYPPYLDGPKR